MTFQEARKKINSFKTLDDLCSWLNSNKEKISDAAISYGLYKKRILMCDVDDSKAAKIEFNDLVRGYEEFSPQLFG